MWGNIIAKLINRGVIYKGRRVYNYDAYMTQKLKKIKLNILLHKFTLL